VNRRGELRIDVFASGYKARIDGYGNQCIPLRGRAAT
jgi:hypothetical protein